MSDNQTNPWKEHHEILINDIKRGRLIPVVGGDINLCGRPLRDKEKNLYVDWQDHKDKDMGIFYPPTTSELAIYLLGKAIEEATNDGRPPLPSILSELIDNKDDRNADAFLPISLANVCQYLQVWDSDWLTVTFEEVLNRNFEPTPAHKFLAQLASVGPVLTERDMGADTYPIIVTACFDNVLEKLLKAHQQSYHLISFVLDEGEEECEGEGGKFEYTAPGKSNPKKIGKDVDTDITAALKTHPVIIKLNGGFRSSQERFAITEDHYIDYLTHQNVKASFPDMLFSRLTYGPHLLFLGYNPRNWNLRVILRRIWPDVLSVKSKQWTFIEEDRKDRKDQDFWKQYATDQYVLKQGAFKLVGMDKYVNILTEKLEQSFPPNKPIAMPREHSTIPVSQNPPATPQRNLIFFSYSHEDKVWLGKIEKGLVPVMKKLKLNPWKDKEIKAGEHWSEEIKAALAAARAAVLLLSPDFLASDFIMNNELPSLLKSAEAEGCTILWIKVRDCSWEDSELKDYQGLYQKTPLAFLNENEFDTTMVEIGKDFANALKDTI